MLDQPVLHIHEIPLGFIRATHKNEANNADKESQK
jgi:hypothetical protein